MAVRPGNTGIRKGGGPSHGKRPERSGGKPSKPSAYHPLKPGTVSPACMTVVPPQPVKDPGDHSSNEGHAFGYFRLGIEKK